MHYNCKIFAKHINNALFLCLADKPDRHVLTITFVVNGCYWVYEVHDIDWCTDIEIVTFGFKHGFGFVLNKT